MSDNKYTLLDDIGQVTVAYTERSSSYRVPIPHEVMQIRYPSVVITDGALAEFERIRTNPTGKVRLKFAEFEHDVVTVYSPTQIDVSIDGRRVGGG